VGPLNVRNKNKARSGRPCRVRGISLIEVIASLVVLGAVLLTVVPMMRWSASQHRSALRQRCAIEAASTALDRLTSAEWELLGRGAKGTEIKPPPDILQSLEGLQLTATVTDEPSPPKSKRVSVEVGWSDQGRIRQLRLTGWVFPVAAGASR